MLTGAHAAQAEPQDLSRAKSQAAVLEEQLAELKDQADALRDTYESANRKLAEAEADAAENASLLAQVQQDQASAQSALSERLAQIYKQGRGSALSILLSSSSLADLMDRVALLERIGKQDADLLDQVKAFRAQVAEREADLAAQLEERQAAAKEVQDARLAVTQKLADTKESLQGKETEIAQLQAEWQAEQAKQAQLQQERQAALEAALAAAKVAAKDPGPGDGGESSSQKGDGGKGGDGGSSGNQGGGQGSSPSHNPQIPNILTPEQIALVAQKAGFSGESLVIAVAVAMSESGSNANAIGRLPTYGLWQVYSSAHPNLINPRDPDASRWYDPYVNATFAWKISSRGTNWRPWAVYTSGHYLRNMAKARTAVALLLSDPHLISSPSAK